MGGKPAAGLLTSRDYKVLDPCFVYRPRPRRYDGRMGTQNLILSYIQACTSGRLGMSDCGPIWQLGVIAALLLIAVIALLAMRFRSRAEPQKA